MTSKLRVYALLAMAVAPSALLAWNWRAMPQLGLYHDDSLYFVSAKSLALGHGYRIASLPHEPWQTKYPPLYPALLSAVWRLQPDFPSNLKLATLFTWLSFPLYIVMVRATLRRLNIRSTGVWILTFAAALNPYAATLSISLMPEILFAALFLGCILAAEQALERDSAWWWALLAGSLGSAAFLARSAALTLLLTVPLCFALRRRFRQALLFVAAMLPAVIAWQTWVARHTSPAQDLVTLYYTNYMGFRLYNVGLADLPLIVWYNLDALLRSAGALLTFDTAVGESWHLERIVAVAALAGIVRLSLRRGALQLTGAACGVIAVLLVWHYQPDTRLVFPLYTLLAAGLWTEGQNLTAALRRAWAQNPGAERAIAALAGAAVLAFMTFLGFTHIYGDFVFLPRVLSAYSSDLRELRPAFKWVSTHTPPDANLYAYDDPVVYLYTGRHACSTPVPPKLFYHNDELGIKRLLAALPQFSREQGLDYALLTSHDFYRDLHGKGARESLRAIGQSPEFNRAYGDPRIGIYEREAANVSRLFDRSEAHGRAAH